MNLKTLSSEGKIAYLIKPILKVLQEAGGQLERSEIKERIADMDDQIAEYSVLEKKSKQTGNTYKEFNFKFNFAIKDVEIKVLLKSALTDEINSREVYMKGIDQSYYYEGFTAFKTKNCKIPKCHYTVPKCQIGTLEVLPCWIY